MNILKNLFLTDFIQIMGPLKSENMSFTIHMFSFPYICYMPNLGMIDCTQFQRRIQTSLKVY